ncbi:THUMP domain-containing protein [uncultured Methanobacterium sp.]|uniref:THUMP domain-containing protein n=1 Tax=uncultured Methanobacterium sp. TaxID=176306 RepID=UPI002AA67384|nr:THUMP domain-containing protein [uncultured Methanobacterium sp.]
MTNEKFEKNADCFVLMVKFKENGEFAEHGINSENKGIEEIETALISTSAWFYITESEFYDIVTVEMNVNPAETINQLRKNSTIAIERAVPLDSVVSSPVESVIKDILKLASHKIDKNESFTVQCQLKDNGLRGIDGIISPDKLINQISGELYDNLNLKYNNKNTDWIIQIEELGEDTGIAVCRPDEILMK